MSNGVKVKAGNIYWVRVEPIVWIVFAGNDLAFSKKIIFDGVPFTKNSGELYMDNFKKSFIYEFMNNYFAKEIIADSILLHEVLVVIILLKILKKMLISELEKCNVLVFLNRKNLEHYKNKLIKIINCYAKIRDIDTIVNIFF